ncbi:MAG: LAGLIDADG family homing endonuclease [Patescibacteria group bacterium]|nr:LAGLIDADG family homing endonuclease [Patescibacteria group bacterium]
MKLSREKLAYIAGFLDGDGSIYVKLKPNSTYRYRFQVSPAIVFFQSQKEKDHLEWLRKIIRKGYLRQRNDGVVEYIIGDMKSIKELLQNLLPYLKLKKIQAQLMLEIIERKKQVKSPKEFIKLAEKIDLFQKINYSKKRIQNSIVVKKVLEKEGLLAP